MTKIKIYLKGIEPIVNWKTKDEDGNTYERIIGAFYPFRRLMAKIYNNMVKKKFKKFGYPIIKCQGCGDGWAEWAIKEPNKGKPNIFVCQHCVAFYDFDITRRRLEVIWELENHINIFNKKGKKGGYI